MLYDLIRDFKSDVDRRFSEIDRRFLEVDGRFEKIDQRFVELERRFEKIDAQFEKMDFRFEKIEKNLDSKGEMLRSIIENEGKVKLSFSRSLTIFYAFLSAMVSGTVSYSLK